MCNVAISTVLMYCFVTLVRLSLVTNKGYLLTYLISKFDRAGFLIFVLVLVSRDFELDQNLWECCVLLFQSVCQWLEVCLGGLPTQTSGGAVCIVVSVCVSVAWGVSWRSADSHVWRCCVYCCFSLCVSGLRCVSEVCRLRHPAVPSLQHIRNSLSFTKPSHREWTLSLLSLALCDSCLLHTEHWWLCAKVWTSVVSVYIYI